MFDVVIVGGGMVGASLAVALKPLNLKVGLIEAFALESSQQPSYDDRTVALSHGSRLIYQGMRLWSEIEADSEAIMHIHVSDRGHFGATRIHASQENVPALGYVVENRVLGRVLYQALPSAEYFELLMPATVVKVSPSTDQVEVVIQEGDSTRTLNTKLLVVADGARSPIREQLGISTTQRDYGQTAIITNVSTEYLPNQTAYERFTSKGPIALLPMTQQRYSVVWTLPHAQVAEVMNKSDEAFLAQLQAAFGYRQGRFTKVGKRAAYPLTLVKTTQETATRSIIMGNASHAIHPVAGQGLNLSLRDVAVLADLLAEAVANQTDIGSDVLLANYAAAREQDYRQTITYTDSLVRLFSNDHGLLGHLRAGGLSVMDRVPPLRRWVTQQSMGINQRKARLARGAELRV
ncbi:2-octaprenyl-6-methoxyphenyl hydroxylase [Thiofilum flexile]|uniref:2-octaprenyl-6-methoxyphenyl hydroxylase n=1 Tax=Thiofilum flexile TaxID=125627 RepID=UPI00036B5A67|nr:2-octaprenyl-6-methoxyphenyl hydroxylase [Thiofilum flexile]